MRVRGWGYNGGSKLNGNSFYLKTLTLTNKPTDPRGQTVRNFPPSTHTWENIYVHTRARIHTHIYTAAHMNMRTYGGGCDVMVSVVGN